MQTFIQSFTSATTWELNIAGNYFATLDCKYALNVRFYKGGQLLDLGEVRGLMAGLEAVLGEPGRGFAFDRLQIDVQAGDTVKVGVGNGQVRYNRGAATVEVGKNAQTQSALFDNQQKTVTNASAVLLAANAARQYLLIQNNDTAGTVFLAFGKEATTTTGLKLVPGGAFELVGTQTTQAIHAIGDTASNTKVITVEG